MNSKRVLTSTDAIIEEFEWGHLRWTTGNKLDASVTGNSTTMTVGQCVMHPGYENFRHYHPNCEEILVVSQGHILHSLGDEAFEMTTGDTIVIPPNVVHNAKNIGDVDAVMTILFSSAERETVGV
ncbi:MAG: cupin domain-containing protein [Chloroflexota bacterium]